MHLTGSSLLWWLTEYIPWRRVQASRPLYIFSFRFHVDNSQPNTRSTKRNRWCSPISLKILKGNNDILRTRRLPLIAMFCLEHCAFWQRWCDYEENVPDRTVYKDKKKSWWITIFHGFSFLWLLLLIEHSFIATQGTRIMVGYGGLWRWVIWFLKSLVNFPWQVWPLR